MHKTNKERLPHLENSSRCGMLLYQKKYTVDEAAKLLGIGSTSLRRLIKDGKLPVIWIGKKMFLLESDLEAYLQSRHGNIGKQRSIVKKSQRKGKQNGSDYLAEMREYGQQP